MHLVLGLIDYKNAQGNFLGIGNVLYLDQGGSYKMYAYVQVH